MPSPKSPGDEDFKRLEYRPGIGVVQWRGVVTIASDSFAEDDQIRVGENLRSDGATGLKCRGGQSKGAVTQVTASLDGIWEAGDV